MVPTFEPATHTLPDKVRRSRLNSDHRNVEHRGFSGSVRIGMEITTDQDFGLKSRRRIQSGKLNI